VTVFNYRAVNDAGRPMRGEIVAENSLDLEARLKELGLELVDCKEKKQRKANRFSSITHKDMIIFCMHLGQLNRAGVPLLEALADVRDSVESPKMRDIIAGVYEAVKGGVLFSDALSAYPKEFDEIFVGLIKAGEKTGDLSRIYDHLIDHFKWTHELKRKVKKALGYPIFLLVVMTGVISILMTAVVPKLLKFILAQGFEIPLHTRALMATSAAFADYWYLIFGIPIGGGMLVALAYRSSEDFAYKCDAFFLKVPVLGATMRKINMARFTHFFSVMFQSGIEVLDALKSAQKVVGNRVLQASIDMVHQSVSGGTSITQSLRMSNQFPQMVVRMFKVGEDSGNMNEALENVKFFYDREVNDSVDNMVGMIQPALTIVMGILIFWVISAVFGPLYDSFSKMPF
jgi:type IV pilus assembly protein PilC